MKEEIALKEHIDALIKEYYEAFTDEEELRNKILALPVHTWQEKCPDDKECSVACSGPWCGMSRLITRTITLADAPTALAERDKRIGELEAEIVETTELLAERDQLRANCLAHGDTIESLQARVQELEAENKKLTEHLTFALGELEEKEALQQRVKELEGVLEHITEYWNRSENNTAMSDALWHIIDQAERALSGKSEMSAPARLEKVCPRCRGEEWLVPPMIEYRGSDDTAPFVSSGVICPDCDEGRVPVAPGEVDVAGIVNAWNSTPEIFERVRRLEPFLNGLRVKEG
jgi:hypothetical protein